MGAGGVDPAPIGSDEFAALMEGAGAPPRIVVAVSGGRDSMALLRLAARWAEDAPERALLAVTVDHKLRPEAAGEAAQVKLWCARIGVPHLTVALAPQQSGNIQGTARAGRLAALGHAAAYAGMPAVLLAHHMEDQAETVLLRLQRGSGVTGLKAMTARRRLRHPQHHRGLLVIRPLLTLARARLEATLDALGQPYIDDPSNADSRFARVRVRALMPELAEAGLTPARLTTAARWAQRAESVLEHAADDLAEAALTLDPQGFAVLDLEPWREAEEETRLRLLARIVGAIGGGAKATAFRPRGRAVEALGAALMRGETSGSLARCTICAQGPRHALVTRERRNLPQALSLPRVRPGSWWDGRFLIDGDTSDGSWDHSLAAVASLTQSAEQGLLAAIPALAALPRLARAGLPVIVAADGRPVALPSLGWQTDDDTPVALVMRFSVSSA